MKRRAHVLTLACASNACLCNYVWKHNCAFARATKCAFGCAGTYGLLCASIKLCAFCASTCAVHRVRVNVLYSVFILYVSADEHRVLYSLHLLHGQLESGHSCVLFSCIFFITDCRETVIILCVITHNLKTSVLNCTTMTILENTCCTKPCSAHINTWCASSCADSNASCANVPLANVHFGKSTQMYVHCSAICSAAESVQTMLKNVQTAPACQSPEKRPWVAEIVRRNFQLNIFAEKWKS